MIISSKKYACETCIKGHRSSSCKHADRPLFEIKKKGRPVTQCEHCRELRKTKQVHVKCICENKESTSLQGSKQGFERAAFPNGLPESLEASVAYQSQGEGTSNDSDTGAAAQIHKCKAGEPCTCVTPRTKKSKRSGVEHDQRLSPVASGCSSHHFPPSTVSNNALIMNRIAELRPVLPRPSMPFGGSMHPPSTSNIHQPHLNPRDKAGQAPYELAYGMTHQQPLHRQSYIGASATSTFSFDEQAYAAPQSGQMQMMSDPSNALWNQNPGFSNNLDFLSLCGCGDDCNCPGCLHHNRSTGAPSSSAYSSCSNPGACGTCLDCTILSLPPSALDPLDTALSIPSVTGQAPHSGSEPVAEWLRQVSMPAGDFQDIPSSFPSQNFSTPSNNFSRQQQQQTWPPRNDSRYSFNFETDVDNLGFPPPNIRGQAHRSRSSIAGSAMDIDGASMVNPRVHPSMDSQFLSVPMSDGSRSRSPSTSSQSSHQGSESSGPIYPYSRPVANIGPGGRVQAMFANTQGAQSAPQLNANPLGTAQMGAQPSPSAAPSSSATGLSSKHRQT